MRLRAVVSRFLSQPCELPRLGSGGMPVSVTEDLAASREAQNQIFRHAESATAHSTLGEDDVGSLPDRLSAVACSRYWTDDGRPEHSAAVIPADGSVRGNDVDHTAGW